MSNYTHRATINGPVIIQTNGDLTNDQIEILKRLFHPEREWDINGPVIIGQDAKEIANEYFIQKEKNINRFFS